MDEKAPAARRWPVVIALVTCAALTWLAFPVWRATGLVASESGYASSVLALMGFAGLVAASATGMFIAALLWAWRRPGDPRGKGVALNSSLVAYSTAVTWLVTIVLVHLWPRIVGPGGS